MGVKLSELEQMRKLVRTPREAVTDYQSGDGMSDAGIQWILTLNNYPRDLYVFVRDIDLLIICKS